ncbi:MAG: C2H2-type zinc finger protein [Thermoplasmata archaeon]
MPFVEYSETEAVCPQCGSAFRTAEVLEAHLRDTHGSPGSESGGAPKPVKCSVCGVRLSSVAALQRHNRESHVA